MSEERDDGRKDRRGYRLEGRVQGVGFRWWTRKTAEGLGLDGAVRNRADGSVEVVAFGPPEILDRFEGLLGRGPSGARVDACERVEPTLSPDGPGFRIVR